MQRWGEVPGPASEERRITETELDWLARGRSVEALYHPVAGPRLRELKRRRTPKR